MSSIDTMLTNHSINSHDEPSVHLTVGIDTHIWDLTYAGLRKLCYRISNSKDKVVDTKLSSELYFRLHVS